MVVAISEKRCGCYVHPFEHNDYNEAPEAFFKLHMNAKILTLGDETPKFMWAPMGKLVPQLPGVVTFAYDLRFKRMIARWKGIFKKYTLSR